MTLDEILYKLMRYCAYQERCPSEVYKKAAGFELSEDETAELMKRLIEENYVNEERYASAFARGKFHNNKWGKIKIGMALRQKEIPEHLIAKGIKEILNKEYIQTLDNLALQKWKSVSAKNIHEKKQKTAVYLQNKGYESDLIWQNLNRFKE